MKLLWKVKVNSTPRQMHNLFAPLTVSGVTTPRGARELAIFAGISDELYAIDVATVSCSGRRSSTASIPQVTTGSRQHVVSRRADGGASHRDRRQPRASTRCTRVSWDGRLHTLDVATGGDIAPPEKFAGPNGKPYALNLFNGVIYTSTAQGCGGNTNAFLSYDLATKTTSIFAPAGGGMWGRRGVAIDPEGRVFMGTGDAPFAAESNSLGTALVAVKLDANKQLQLVDYFAPPNANWLFRRDLDLNVTPMAFDYRGTEVPRRHEQGMPSCGCSTATTLAVADNRTTLQTYAAALQRRAGVRRQGIWGALAAWQSTARGGSGWSCRSTGRSAGSSRRPRTRAPGQRRRRRLHARATQRQLGARAAMAVARHGHGRACHRRQRRLFMYASGEDTTQVFPDRAFNDPRGRAARRRHQQRRVRRHSKAASAALYALDALTGRSSGTAATTSPPGIITAG